MTEEDAKKKRHREELYDLAEQCKKCRFRRKDAPTKDCEIHRKLVVDDSPVAWKHKKLFMPDGRHCKMFQVGL
jgi:hypothetical protein